MRDANPTLQPDVIADIAAELWSQLERGRASLVQLFGQDGQQPVSHRVDRDNKCLWFIGAADSGLAAGVTPACDGQLVFSAPAQDYFACLDGVVERAEDAAVLDSLWSFAARAWFDGGREDPNVVLFRFRPQKAAVWTPSARLQLINPRMVQFSFNGSSPVHGNAAK
ncbi:pyridoxamine 5'-phosphate oxidase family protein [Phaeobacter sp.]|uniref:pyridoxamine 5'-phosphate oxidase family protein n=1 Tax=Phaeobacter sp. TaxID=1902409 RepID=UPI0025EF77CC|nr:pyridoxamine 5'-phosphate oxidase family protein [Phaeobacter sp.]